MTTTNTTHRSGNALSQWVSDKSRGVATWGYGMMDRHYHNSKMGDKFSRYMSGPDKAVRVRLMPLGLLLGAVTLLAYRQGQENRKGHGGDRNIAIKDAAIATGAYGLASVTSGLYPLAAMGKTVHDVSKADNDLDRLKAVTTNGIWAGLGWIAIMLGRGLTFAMSDHEDAVIKNILLDDQTIAHVDKPDLIELKSPFENLRDKLKVYFHNLDHKLPIDKADVEDIRNTKIKILELVDKDAIREALSKDTDAMRATRRLINTIDRSESFYVQAVRMLNPIAAFVVVSALVSYPLAKRINAHFDRKHADMAARNFDPFNTNQATSSSHHHPGSTPTHGGGHSTSHEPPYAGYDQIVETLKQANTMVN